MIRTLPLTTYNRDRKISCLVTPVRVLESEKPPENRTSSEKMGKSRDQMLQRKLGLSDRTGPGLEKNLIHVFSLV